MGFVHYVSQHLPHIATVAALETALTGKGEFTWTLLHDETLKQVKDIVGQHLTLKPINYESQNQSIFVVPDVSMIWSGSWLGQGIDIEHVNPSQFHSKRFTPAKPNYLTNNKAHLLTHRFPSAWTT